MRTILDYSQCDGGEAILRDSGGLCNLTEVVVRPGDTLRDLREKVRLAAILGTLQSTLVDFRYLRKVWSDNQREERLLGISLTGIMDHPVLSGREYWPRYNFMIKTKEDLEFFRSLPNNPYAESAIIGDHHEVQSFSLADVLEYLKEVARETNKIYAKRLGIPPSKQLTLVKPSGTVSQLCSTSSGIHPRYAKYYYRRVTQDNKDPLTQLMVEQGIPYVSRNDKTIFSFPVASPEGAITAEDIGPLEQLELWLTYRDHWCEGNPSQTVYYTDDTFCDLQAWVHRHFDKIGGLSFFPKDDFIYDKEAQPFLEITEEEYREALSAFPENIDWSKLGEYETEDSRDTVAEFACGGGQCDI